MPEISELYFQRGGGARRVRRETEREGVQGKENQYITGFYCFDL